jgi:hypothetical protein
VNDPSARAVASAVDPARAPGLLSRIWQIVVQVVVRLTAVGQPRVPGEDRVLVEHDDIVGAQRHPHPPSDEPGRDRVVGLADGDPGVAADLRR